MWTGFILLSMVDTCEQSNEPSGPLLAIKGYFFSICATISLSRMTLLRGISQC
jgi:hypothetical protein